MINESTDSLKHRVIKVNSRLGLATIGRKLTEITVKKHVLDAYLWMHNYTVNATVV